MALICLKVVVRCYFSRSPSLFPVHFAPVQQSIPVGLAHFLLRRRDLPSVL
ncbi:hypothetical protein PDIG_86550 [Penicillium digitatum PHI26]|uniref:Uncharacterized protein n=2 Tax=Penicillium digitatum TaxID=36651 RepID=K9F716_PEND2|nr:hypothetical protein PDIP_32570 [Penicillium digitatum Pd1]EKV04854.1 hypothetical protein PDIG_86550 [Penicillium digitatum PHI26]EKV17241.1 hypothetical protein PDIP_32570 [Penicillium digitatum Pd1]